MGSSRVKLGPVAGKRGAQKRRQPWRLQCTSFNRIDRRPQREANHHRLEAWAQVLRWHICIYRGCCKHSRLAAIQGAHGLDLRNQTLHWRHQGALKCRNLMKKPLVLKRVLYRDPNMWGIRNQGCLNQFSTLYQFSVVQTKEPRGARRAQGRGVPADFLFVCFDGFCIGSEIYTKNAHTHISLKDVYIHICAVYIDMSKEADSSLGVSEMAILCSLHQFLQHLPFYWGPQRSA